MLRLFIRWALSVLVLWIAQLVGLIVVPVALSWAVLRRNLRLPHWASAWDNHDYPSGDIYWQTRYGLAAHTSFWLRFRWLALRNRAHNLSRWLGVDDPGRIVYCKGVENGYADDDRRWTGWLWIRRERAFESYGVLPYPFTGGKCGLRWRLGWKIKGGAKEDRPHRLVCNVMPLRRIG